MRGETRANWLHQVSKTARSVGERLNLTFRLVIAHGYADLVTPYMASRYVLEHLPPFTQPERAQLQLYPGGHMFYISAEARQSFTTDMRAFFGARHGS